MSQFVIEGGHRLSGEITPQGAKNEALQVLNAVLLTDEPVTIDNIPEILDIMNLIELFRSMGVKVTRNSKIRVVRDGIVVFEDEISSLRRFKDDVKEVAQGYECGIGLEKFNDIKVGDVLESFIMEEIPR